MIGILSRGLAGLALGIVLMIASYQLGIELVHADPIAASAGSGSAITLPADQLHDPVAQPTAAFDDVKAAEKLGWPVALLAAVILLGRGAGQLGRKLSWLAWLSRGKAAVITAGVVTLAIAAFNAVALGGTWFAAAMAAASAGFALMHPVAPPQPAPPSS